MAKFLSLVELNIYDSDKHHFESIETPSGVYNKKLIFDGNIVETYPKGKVFYADRIFIEGKCRLQESSYRFVDCDPNGDKNVTVTENVYSQRSNRQPNGIEWVVVSNYASVRTSPNGSITGYIPKGIYVTQIAAAGDWIEIAIGDDLTGSGFGWIAVNENGVEMLKKSSSGASTPDPTPEPEPEPVLPDNPSGGGGIMTDTPSSDAGSSGYSGLSADVDSDTSSSPTASTNYKRYEVVANSVNVRSGPGVNYTPPLGTVKKGDILIAYEISADGGWIRHGEGRWSALFHVDGTAIIVETDREKQPVEEYESTGYIPSEKDFLLYENKDATDNTTIRNAMAILGLPYQFLSTADPSIDPNGHAASLGRVYAQRIISRTPLLLLTPGQPRFMTNYNRKDKENVLKKLLKTAENIKDTAAGELLTSKGGRYYTFSFAYNDYYNFVNPMCRIAARLLNIHNYTLEVEKGKGGVNLDRVDWQKFTATRIESFADIGMAGAVPFYIQSETQISDSFDNSTGESLLASTVNGFSDSARELAFLLGYGGSMLGVNINLSEEDRNTITENVENFNDYVGKLLGTKAGNFARNLTDNVFTVSAGGKLIFPEIWNDSSFGRSYNISMKFVTPDCDKLSWYLNVCVPVLHLIAMVAPRGADKNAAGYYSPFLIRGYYKGLFNCDMGIITNMTISKGTEGGWTKEGLPTVVEVNFTLKDLYDEMSISNGMSGGLFSTDAIKNTALMDYIANFCGININKPEVGRQIDIWFTQTIQNRISDTVTKNIWGGIEQGIQNAIMNIYNTTLR